MPCVPPNLVPSVEAFRSTGTSPGGSFQAQDRPPVAFDVHGPEWGPPVVVLGGISSGRHVLPTARNPTPGWWPGVVGAGGAIDPSAHRVIGIDYLPTIDVEPLEPSATVRSVDQAGAVLGVLNTLGISAATIVGASYGGNVALAFAALYPDRTRSVVALGAAHRPHPMATALRSVQRRIVELGARTGQTNEALALARGLAMTTYRSAIEFEDRFGTAPDCSRENGRLHFPVENYLEACGRAFAASHSPTRFVVLSESIDQHEIDPAMITVPVALLSFENDAVAPPWLVAELHERLSGPSLHETLATPYGHDAFLKEPDSVTAFLRRAEGVDR